MRKSRRKRRRRRRTRRRGAGKKRRKQTFQPWQGKHSFNNNDNLDNISHKSVESYGNFPDTTNGELSVEIEGQQPRDDGGGGPGVQFTAQARNDAPKNTYYYSRGFKALGDGSPSGLAQALAAAPEAEKEAALWKAKTAVAWDGRRRRGKRWSGRAAAAGDGSGVPRSTNSPIPFG